jgi:hypothetical protein
MVRRLFSILIVAVPLLASTAFAHHSITAEFDTENPITLTGTVKEVVWMSPHISVFIDVRQDNGDVFTYEVQGGPPNRLFRSGARKTDLMPGDAVVVEGARARNPESLRVGQGAFSKPDGAGVWQD